MAEVVLFHHAQGLTPGVVAQVDLDPEATALLVRRMLDFLR